MRSLHWTNAILILLYRVNSIVFEQEADKLHAAMIPNMFQFRQAFTSNMFHCILVTNLHAVHLTDVTARSLKSPGTRDILHDIEGTLLSPYLKTSRGNKRQNYNRYEQWLTLLRYLQLKLHRHYHSQMVTSLMIQYRYPILTNPHPTPAECCIWRHAHEVPLTYRLHYTTPDVETLAPSCPPYDDFEGRLKNGQGDGICYSSDYSASSQNWMNSATH